MDRSGLIIDITAFISAGLHGHDIFLDLIETLNKDPSLAVWAAVYGTIIEMLGNLQGTEAHQKLQVCFQSLYLIKWFSSFCITTKLKRILKTKNIIYLFVYS